MSGLHWQRHLTAYRSIAAAATCLALMLTAASQRASAAEQAGRSWDVCKDQPFLEGD